MHMHTTARRWISLVLRGFAVFSLLSTALVSPGVVRADFTYTENGALHPPIDSINFPGTPAGGSPSIAFGTWFTNPTGGVPGDIQNPPPNGSLFFNGYDATNTALNLHDTNGGAFIEPFNPADPNGPHPAMFTTMISAGSLTDSSGKPQVLTGIDFQLDYNNNGASGTVTFTVFDQFGNQVGTSGAQPLKTDGQDKWAIQAINGEFFSFIEVQTSSSAPLIDFKNIDITAEANPVPEPASLTLSAIGLAIGMGYYGVRRRRAAVMPKNLA